MTSTNPAAFDDTVIDRVLQGGLPRHHTTLVTGGPGTGKSTLSMQWLQAGLDDGEACLFISTEQSRGDFADSFADFSFDLDHDDLDFLSIHPTPGASIEGGENSLTIQTLDIDESLPDAEFLGEGFSLPFTPARIRELFASLGSYDRVVLDSANGLAAAEDDILTYRRVMLDIISLFNTEMNATALFTAEDGTGTDRLVPKDVLQFATHGVINLSRRQVRGDLHRFIEVLKLRGVNHDTRSFEYEITHDGLKAGPLRRSQPPALKTHHHLPLGVPGFDDLCGEGLATGGGVLVKHDGRVNLTGLYGVFISAALNHGYSLLIVPTLKLSEHRFRTILEAYDHTVEDLLDDDQLFVVDMINAWNTAHANVYEAFDSADGIMSTLERVDDDVGDNNLFTLENANAMTSILGETATKEVRRYHEAQLMTGEDVLIHMLNEDVSGRPVSAFYENAAEQVIEMWMADTGLQYLTLEKSPCGFVGTTAMISYIQDEPYLEVQRPPEDRSNPYGLSSYE